MNTWKIIQPYQKSRTPLLEGQAVIVANHDHFGIYARTTSGIIDECCLTFQRDDLASIIESFHSVYTMAKEHGCFLLLEDTVLQTAKNWAVASIMSSYEEESWLWDYLVAVCKDPSAPRNFNCAFANPCEAHERDDSYKIYESLVAQRDSLMLFAGIACKTMANDADKAYLACEFDEWRSANSRIIRGIFSTEDKALEALTVLYGAVQSDPDGGHSGYKPTNNPNKVSLNILTTSLNEVAEI